MSDYWEGVKARHEEAMVKLRATRDLAKSEGRENDEYLAKKELAWHGHELSICRQALIDFK